MPDWLVEEGIGEHRAVRLAGEDIFEARLEWPGELATGQIAEAVLISRTARSSRGTARLDSGVELLVDRMPASATEGSRLRVEITRPPVAERGRFKRAQARATEQPLRPLATLAERLRLEGQSVRIVRRFPVAGWDDLIAEAFAGEVAFAGGSIVLSPTPAMLLIDVDGTLPPRGLALAAAPAVAAALRRLDIGGSVGIDFPTLERKEDRRAVDQALADALRGWPHEGTAMNGFGFVQLVARLQRISILHRAVFHPAATAARWLLRRAERLEGAGAVQLASHPALERHLRPEFLSELTKRTGREVRWRADPALALDAPHAQLVPL